MGERERESERERERDRAKERERKRERGGGGEEEERPTMFCFHKGEYLGECGYGLNGVVTFFF